MRRTGIKMKAKNIEMKKTRNPVPSSSIQVSGYLFYPSLFIMFTSYPTNSSTMDITCESILLQVSNALTSDTILVLFYITSKNKSVTFLGIILFLDLCNTSFFSFFYHSFLGISICLFSSIVLSILGNSILLLFWYSSFFFSRLSDMNPFLFLKPSLLTPDSLKDITSCFFFFLCLQEFPDPSFGWFGSTVEFVFKEVKYGKAKKFLKGIKIQKMQKRET